MPPELKEYILTEWPMLAAMQLPMLVQEVSRHERVPRRSVPIIAGPEAMEKELAVSKMNEEPAGGGCVDRTAGCVCEGGNSRR
ncbi:unnamed protein product [Peronospora belbahrii]|uniref:Uncharacterized protein n=1 Tax=Peronospora belbahrii TaxID=622444 RepID=A0AAU9LBY4_9STRA|nr:unnamed protein product [Peronospora belbahrii]